MSGNSGLKWAGYAGVVLFLLYKCTFDNPSQRIEEEKVRFVKESMEKEGHIVHEAKPFTDIASCKEYLNQKLEKFRQVSSNEILDISGLVGDVAFLIKREDQASQNLICLKNPKQNFILFIYGEPGPKSPTQ
jgi:hypothetical protein